MREPGVAFAEGSGGSYTVGGVASNVNTLKDGDRSAASGHWTVTSGRTLDIAFAGTREIEEVVLVGNPGLTSNPQPKETDTYAPASSFDVSTYTVQTWSGSAWVTQGTVSGNKNVIRHVSFAPVATTKLRIILVDDASNGQTANDNMVSLAEVEVYTTPEGGGTQVQRRRLGQQDPDRGCGDSAVRLYRTRAGCDRADLLPGEVLRPDHRQVHLQRSGGDAGWHQPVCLCAEQPGELHRSAGAVCQTLQSEQRHAQDQLCALLHGNAPYMHCSLQT